MSKLRKHKEIPKPDPEEEIPSLERSIRILEEGLEYLHRKLWLLKKKKEEEYAKTKTTRPMERSSSQSSRRN